MKSKNIFHEFINKNNIKVTNTSLFFKVDNRYCPLTWNNAKKYPKFLKKYNKFRKIYVDTLLSEVLEKLDCEPDCYSVSAGSISIDSDYDITVYGNNSSKIVDLFNDKFIPLFKKDSSIIFDTNIYGTSFFHTNILSNYDYSLKDSKECTPSNFIYYINTENNKEDIKNQHIWAFVKLYMYIYKIEDTEFKHILLNIFNNIKEVKDYTSNAIKLLKILQSQKTDYVKELHKYDIIKHEFEKKPYKDIKLAIKLKNQISKTNFYGVETYFTQGAVNHVVAKIQLDFKNLKLSRDEYIDSLIENLGDIIKEYNIYHDNYIKFITYSSKYIIRIGDAINNIKYGNNSKKIITVATKLRKLRGSSNTDLIKKELVKLQDLLKFKNNNSKEILYSLIEISMKTIIN